MKKLFLIFALICAPVFSQVVNPGGCPTCAPIASPTFTGIPAAPTATIGTNTTQIATTAFVLANAGGGGPTLGATQTWTGVNTFANNTYFSNGTFATNPVSTNIADTGPATVIDLFNSGQPADNRRAIIDLVGTTFAMAFVNDATTAVQQFFTVNGNSSAITSINFVGPTNVQGALTATTGTVPLFTIAGTPLNNPHAVFGSTTLALGTSTVTLLGSAAYTSNLTWRCSANDVTTPLSPVAAIPASGSTLTVTGTGTDTVSFSCIGT